MRSATIRSCTVDDADAITFLNLSSFGLRFPVAQTRQRLKAILQNPAHHIFLALVDKRVVGYLHAGVYEQTFRPAITEVICIAVHSDSRKAGVGRMLMAACEEWAKEKGTDGIWLTSTFKRTGAHAFYEALGYTHVQDRKAFKKLFESDETPEEPLEQG